MARDAGHQGALDLPLASVADIEYHSKVRAAEDRAAADVFQQEALESEKQNAWMEAHHLQRVVWRLEQLLCTLAFSWSSCVVVACRVRWWVGVARVKRAMSCAMSF